MNPQISHSPVLQASRQSALEIRINLEEGAGQVASAVLLWRHPGGEFHSTDLEPVSAGLSAVIPADQVLPPTLEYLLIVRLPSGQELTYPLREPYLAPQVITILPAAGGRGGAPEFVVLYPREGEVIFDSEVHIAVSIFDADSVFDTGTLEAYLDGEKIAPQQQSSTYLLLVAPALKEGAHQLVLRSRDFQGHYHADFVSTFRTVIPRQGRPAATFSWSFNGEARWENFGGDQEGILRGDWRAQGIVGRWQYGARCYLTSEEAWNRQPQDRFLLSLSSRRLSLEVGDATPMFSDLVLSGKRIRGVEFGLHAGSAHVLGTFGEVYKAIPESSYRRFLGAVRPYFTNSSGALLGFTVLKAKDDVASLPDSSSVSPQDNVVVGLDAAVPFWRQKLRWSISGALSLTALDIRGGAVSDSALKDAGVDVPFNPQSLEPLIVINESLAPPDPRSMSSLAWMTSLDVRHLGQALSLNYRSAGPAYYSLGNPYLQNDLVGWGLSDQFGLWKNSTFVSLGLSRLHDNLKNSKSTTTKTTSAWGSVAFYPAAPAPQGVVSFNLSRGQNSQNNLDTLMVTSNQASDTVFSDLRRKDLSSSINASLTQQISLFQLRHLLTVRSNLSQYHDEVDDRPPDYPGLNSVYRNYGFSWRAFLTSRQSFTWDYSYYSSRAAAQSFRYHQIGGAYQGRFWPRRLALSLGGSRRTGAGNLDRWQADFSADWEFVPQYTLRGSATHFFNDNLADEGLYRLYLFKRF